jgi:hypothetical protein
MLTGYASHPAAQVSDTDRIWIRLRYGSGAYWIHHVAYRIILFSLTEEFDLRYGF